MNHRRRRRMTVRPSKSMITFSRVMAGVFAVIGLAFLTQSVQMMGQFGGGFGLIGVLVPLVFVGVGIFGACNKKGLYFSYEWSIDEETEGDSPASSGGASASSAEERLAELQRLYDQRLITAREFEEKRQEILRDL